MNKRFTFFAIILIVIGALLGGLFGRMPSRSSAEGTVTKETLLADYREAARLVESEYAGKVDFEKLNDSSIQGMLWTLDPHSSYFTAEEYRKLTEDQASQFYGIGVSILQHRDGVYVQSVIPNTPADKAGLRYGDRFLTVGGKDAKEWTSAEVSKNVRGERGTTVKVQIDRVGNASPLDFEIVRGGVPLPSVRNVFMLPESIGYVGLTGGFQQTTAEELSMAIGDLKKQGMKSLILDLRGNPGGILEQAVAVVSKFVPGGQVVVSVKGANGQDARELRSTSGGNENFPLVVMINGGSASASEIVAGAIQDYARGLVVGSDSFGKGLVQRVFRLPYGTGLTLTTARYYTPFGRSLQRDYSNGSIYDYYTHGDELPENADLDVKPKPTGSPVTTANGRVLYGGRGIEPDIVADGQKFSPIRGRINEAAFFFVRQLVSGKISGFENFKVEKQSFKATLQPNEFSVSDRVFESFRSFAAANKDNGLTAENILGQAEYARRRLREELATANYSTEAGVQVLLEADPQVLKAIETMPQAANMVATFAQNFR
ncbi:MAG TPA: S41 family peptidase [Pyrinomonadaceae bacterium]|nr:S41 family peptidase [Pyrinomonadaceae bacterium]